jgi:hypothetical protein
MEDDNGVERHIEWKKEKQSIERIKDSLLRIRIEGITAELVGIP